MTLSREQLMEIAKNYWPSAADEAARQEVGPEAMRLHARWQRELGAMERWGSFLDGLSGALPTSSVGDASATVDACLRCVVYPVKGRPLPPLHWVVVGCASIVAPVYTVYGVQFEYVGSTRLTRSVALDAHSPHIEPVASLISRRIEEVFGFSPLPREVAETPAPLLVQWKQPPETMLFHALFTNEPDRLP